MPDDGLENAAILLMAMGAESAAEVFKHLSPKEVQRLGETMAALKITTHTRISDVISLQVRLYPLPDQEHLSQEHLSAAESSAVCSGVEATTDANR